MGDASAEVASVLRIPEWMARTAVKQSHRWTSDEIADAVATLAQLSVAMKGGVEPEQALTDEQKVYVLQGRLPPWRQSAADAARGSGAEAGGGLGHRTLAVRSLVLVNDALEAARSSARDALVAASEAAVASRQRLPREPDARRYAVRSSRPCCAHGERCWSCCA